jgi:hypothetical protein
VTCTTNRIPSPLADMGIPRRPPRGGSAAPTRSAHQGQAAASPPRGPPTEGKQRRRQPLAPPLGRQHGGRSGAGARVLRAFVRTRSSPPRWRHLQVSRGSPAELITRSTGQGRARSRASWPPAYLHATLALPPGRPRGSLTRSTGQPQGSPAD